MNKIRNKKIVEARWWIGHSAETYSLILTLIPTRNHQEELLLTTSGEYYTKTNLSVMPQFFCKLPQSQSVRCFRCQVRFWSWPTIHHEIRPVSFHRIEFKIRTKSQITWLLQRKWPKAPPWSPSRCPAERWRWRAMARPTLSTWAPTRLDAVCSLRIELSFARSSRAGVRRRCCPVAGIRRPCYLKLKNVGYFI